MYFKNFWFCYVKTKAMYFFIWWYICYSGIFTVVVYLLHPFGMGLPFLVVLLCGGQSNVLFYAVIYSRWWYIRCGGVFAACIWDGASLPYCGAAWGLSVRPCSSMFSWGALRGGCRFAPAHPYFRECPGRSAAFSEIDENCQFVKSTVFLLTVKNTITIISLLITG